MRLKLFLALILLSVSAVAEDKIEGAFGMRLGQPFDPASAIGQGELTDGTPMYRFNPAKKFRSFSAYYVLITPKTQKVYSIWGIGSIENNEKCKSEQKLIMAILSGKYGEKKEQGAIGALYDSEVISQGDRHIMTKCSGFSDVTIDVRYKDTQLAQIAENERIELESQKLDSSGL